MTHVLKEPPEGWEGETGLPRPELIEAALEDLPDEVECFLCGPTQMSRMAEETLRAAGVPGARIRFELFEMA